MKTLNTRRIAANGITAGLYAAVTLLTASFAYGPVQLRIAEALSVLCCFSPSMTVGITLGCLLANIFSAAPLMDMVIGTAATLLACLWMTRIRRAWLLPLPNVLLNGILVGGELAWLTDAFLPTFPLYAAQVAAGELIVMVALGLPLYHYLKKSRLTEKIL